MKRRDFLAAASASVLPVFLDGFGLKALNRQSALVQALGQTQSAYSDRVLVIVYLNGGNDGLNTVIPLDQMSQYNALRSNIAIPQAKVLTLDGNAKTGLHPAMTGLRDLYNDGNLSIVHSVSYPNPDQSHYRATDIWMTGVDASVTETTGWAGRYLENQFPGYPVGYPNTQMEDPLAIQIGYLTSTALLGSQQSMGIALSDPDSFYQLVGGTSATSPSAGELPCCDAGDLIAYIRKQQALSVGYASEIKRAADAGKNLAAYPESTASNALAEQLKIVARLIHGGLKTKIYFVSMSGFDTHSGQVDSTDTTVGDHATRLGKLSAAIAAFQQDITLQGTADRVVGMTFSEFGRRANSNASRGTDHGVAAPMFVFGTNVRHRTIGQNPDLSNLTGQTTNREIPMQIDFRRVYSDILTDWFGAAQTTTSSLLYRPFPTVSLFSDMVETVASGDWTNAGVWTVGRTPMAGEYVRVNAGHTVTLRQSVDVRNLRLDGKLVTGGYTVRMTG